jgi:small GTP-binding protein
MTNRVVLLGEVEVGKTSIIRRLAQEEFDSAESPTVTAFYTNVSIRIDSGQVTIQLCDTSGQERYHSIASLYYRDAAAAVVVFDLTRPDTFQSVSSWIEEVQRLAPKDIAIMVLGNKSDIRDSQRVTAKDIQQWKIEHNYSCWTTSASDGTGIREAFEDLAGHLVQVNRPTSQAVEAVVNLERRADGQGGCC